MTLSRLYFVQIVGISLSQKLVASRPSDSCPAQLVQFDMTAKFLAVNAGRLINSQLRRYIRKVPVMGLAIAFHFRLLVQGTGAFCWTIFT